MLIEERTQILELWQQSGKPSIPLRQGETCLDLEKFLSHRDIRNSDIEAIKAWAQTKEAEVTTEKQPQLFTGGIKNQDMDQTVMPTEKQAQALSKVQAHIQYQLADGTPVPGVTTVLNILAKPALIQWAWNLGCQNLDWREVRDSAGDIGTLAHFLIMCHLKDEVPDTSEYSQADIEKATNCLNKFKNWLKEHPISPVMIETPLVSEEYKFGGTLDLFAEYNDEFILVDFKTGKSLYDEYGYLKNRAGQWPMPEY